MNIERCSSIKKQGDELEWNPGHDYAYGYARVIWQTTCRNEIREKRSAQESRGIAVYSEVVGAVERRVKETLDHPLVVPDCRRDP